MFDELAPADLPPRTPPPLVVPTVAQIPMSAGRPAVVASILNPLPLHDLDIIGATSPPAPAHQRPVLLDLLPPPLPFGPRSATHLPRGTPLLDIRCGGATVDEPAREDSAPPSRRGSRASTCSGGVVPPAPGLRPPT